MAELKQYGVLAIGLLMAGGFAFGGMASYSSLIDTGPTGDNEIEAELPEENFKDGSYDLSSREKMYLTLREDVVFVSAIYNTSEQKQGLMQLQNITQNFNGRAYVSIESADESGTASAYRITSFPNVLIYGYVPSGQQTPIQVEGEINEKNVASRMCQSMNEWGDVQAYCART